ncbi:MAG: LamG domain-containing protein [Phycisphaerae bacterium]|nr:LamG domain-containing protein [Phycisphaerae bacterium]
MMSKLSDNEILKFNVLLGKLIEGQANADEIALVDKMICENKDYASQYITFVSDCAFLETSAISTLNGTESPELIGDELLREYALEDIQSSWLSEQKEKAKESVVLDLSPVQRKPIQFINILRIGGAIAALIMVALILNLVQQITRSYESPVRPSVVAVVEEQLDAKWVVVNQSEIKVGTELVQGKLQLESGLAKIRFENGAEVFLQGPVSVELLSGQGMELFAGKMTAHVCEEAVGFSVYANDSKIVDLGTEFGITLNSQGQADVHIFDGKVALLPGGEQPSKKIELAQGNARSIDQNHNVSSIEINESAFVVPKEFDAMMKSQQGDEYCRWLAYSYQLRRDRSLVAYYTFEKDNDNPDLLINRAAETAGRMDGKLGSVISEDIKPQWVPGRWSEKTALKFSFEQQTMVQIAQDLALDIQGDITLAAWIYCSGKFDGGDILAYRSNQADISNYQFAYRVDVRAMGRTGGTFYDKIQYSFGGSELYYSQNTVNPESRWQLLVMTHDGREVRIYIDGQLFDSKLFAQNKLSPDSTLYIGTDNRDSDFDYFNGAIGEIAIFNRVLNAQQIMQMYEAGKTAE